MPGINMDIDIVQDFNSIIIPLTSTWVSYGPWFATSDQAKGMVDIDVDQSLVPWNFERVPSSQEWDKNLDEAGEERLQRKLAVTDYVDTAVISVAGFPEFGPTSQLGFNSNITSISTNFGSGGVKTIYSLATYSERPGAFRKSDYDNISVSRVDSRSEIVLPENINLKIQVDPLSVNRFHD